MVEHQEERMRPPGARSRHAALVAAFAGAQLAALPAAAFGAAEPAPLVLAFSELPPWKTRTVDPATGATFYGGAYTEIVRELARRTGLPLEVAPCPLKRCLLMLQEGQADVLIGAQESEGRRSFLHYLQTPYRKHSSDKVFYVPKGKGASLARFEDLQPLRIGIRLGADYFPRFDADTSLRKDAITDVAANFKKLVLGRVDAVLIAEDQGEALLSSLGLRDQVEKAQLRVADPTPRAVAIARRSRHAARMDQFEAAMTAMAKDGTLDAIFRRHYFEACKVPIGAVPID